MKKALMNASVASMIYKFNMNNIDILESLDYQVDVACNFGKENPISQEEILDFRKKLKEKNIRVYETTCPRSILAVKNMWTAYKQLKTIADNENYDLVHTQSPIGGVICRLAFRKARKKGTKVIYTSHGYHFYKGGSLMNWIIFYPIEKRVSKYTDIIVAINEEDYLLTKDKFHAKDIFRIPGVGIDLSRFILKDFNRNEYRKLLGLKENDIAIISVGEVNINKNHSLIIKAIAEMKNPNIHFFIAGNGNQFDDNEELAKKLGVDKQVHFWGYRTDIPELNTAVDLFAFPSIREGLGLAAIEALACGTPVVGMNTRGINEYCVDNETGFLFDNSSKSCANAIERCIEMIKNDESLTERCKKKARKYGKDEAERIMKSVYSKL